MKKMGSKLKAKPEKREVKVNCITDDDVERIMLYLPDRQRLKEQVSRRGSLAPSRASLNKSGRALKEEVNGHKDEPDELFTLVNEELPEEFKDTSLKPTALLGDVDEHHTSVSFQTPKKRHGMVLKAQQSASKFSTPGKGNENQTPLKSPCPIDVDREACTPGRRVSFGGKMGATPSSGVGRGNRRKSVLKRKENVMANLTEKLESPKTRRSLAKLKKNQNNLITSKTPRAVRAQTKAMIQRAAVDTPESETEDGIDFSEDEDSSYSPCDESKESSTDSSDEESDSENKILSKPGRGGLPLAVTTRKQNKQPLNYVNEFTSDTYFETQSAKSITSNNTLRRLNTPRLHHDRLCELLADSDAAHYKPITELTDDYRSLAQRWLFTLRQGYSVLLYGLGSKRHLLQSLHHNILSNYRTLIVNGFFPGLTVKEVIDCILSDLLGVKDVPSNVLECVELVESIQSARRAEPLYLLVHNLDGPSLRCDRVQMVFSRLAHAPNTHLIATIDHINAPLMWDQAKLRRYNFAWWDVTTFVAYLAETSFESSLLIQQAGDIALSSLHSVFKSLTTNAKAIFMMIAKHQMENKGNRNYTGMSFRDLYWKSRDAFIVSTDGALRAQLTEFLDHHLIKSRRGADGTEALSIPIEEGVLAQFIESQLAEE